MDAQPEQWWELGFTYEAVVDAWQDARLAAAIERVWVAAQRPPDAQAFWMASSDEYAFRWFLNAAMAALLDAASITWRCFVLRPAAGPHERARRFLGEGGAGGAGVE